MFLVPPAFEERSRGALFFGGGANFGRKLPTSKSATPTQSMRRVVPQRKNWGDKIM